MYDLCNLNMFPKINRRGYSFNMQLPVIERYAVQMVEINKCEIYIPIL